MSKQSFTLLHCLRTMSGAYRQNAHSDAELLERFVATHDDTAVATLAVRHGPMVWEICRRILGNDADAEEAYQVTFLALVTKAAKIRVTDTLAGWLCQVARQSALDGRKSKKNRQKLQEHLRRQGHEETGAENQETATDESYALLYEELAKLSEKQRVVLVLHYLEGKTQEEVAQILCVGKWAVRNRLNRAKAILLKRLTQRGLTLGAAALAAILQQTYSRAAMPPGLVAKTVQAATAFRDGKLKGILAKFGHEALKHTPHVTPWWKSNWMIIILCGIGLGTAGGVAWKISYFGTKAVDTFLAQQQQLQQAWQSEKPTQPPLDIYGDPLPSNALARIGTIRFRNTRGRGTATFLEDGKTVVAAQRNDEFVFWETATGRETRRLKPRFENSGDGIGAVSSDGKKLAINRTVLRDLGQHVVQIEVVQVWDLVTAPARKLWEQRRPVHFQPRSLQFTPNEKTLAVAERGKAGRDGSLCLYDTRTGKLCQQVKGFDYQFGSIDFSPDGKTLATSQQLWDTTTWQARPLKRTDKQGVLRNATTSIESTAFSPDGKVLAAVVRPIDWQHPAPNMLSLWNTMTGSEIRQITSVSPYEYIRLAFHPDGRTLIAADGHGRFHFWNTTTGKASAPSVSAEVVYRGKDAFSAVDGTCFSHDRRFFLRSDGEVICVWSVETGRLVAPIPTHAGMHGWAEDLVFSRDGKSVATWSGPDEIQLWDAESGRPGQQLCGHGKAYIKSPLDYSSEDCLAAWTSWPRGDVGKELKREDRFIVWDVKTGKALPERPAPRENGDLRAISENGQRLLWASKEKLTLVDRFTAKEVQHFPGLPEWGGVFVTLSADGGTVLMEGIDQGKFHRFRVYSVKTGREILNLDGQSEGIYAWHNNGHGEGRLNLLALSPDGRWLAAYRAAERAALRSGVMLWELASKKEVARFPFPQQAGLRCLLWSPDGRLLAGGDEQGTVWLWDMIALRKIDQFDGHRGEVISLAFSPDGSRLASGSADTTALIWDLLCLRHHVPSTAPRSSSPDKLWNALGEIREVGEALRAMDELAQRPDLALPLLRRRLRRPPAPDPKRIAALLAQLNDQKFQVRRRAVEQLVRMDERIAPALRTALANKPSTETRRHINDVLQRVAVPQGCDNLTTKQLQAYRGVTVLEWIASPKARRLLEELADTTEGVQATEARTALQRLANRLTVPSPK